MLHAWIPVEDVSTSTPDASLSLFVGEMGLLGERVARKADHLKHGYTIMALFLQAYTWTSLMLGLSHINVLRNLRCTARFANAGRWNIRRLKTQADLQKLIGLDPFHSFLNQSTLKIILLIIALVRMHTSTGFTSGGRGVPRHPRVLRVRTSDWTRQSTAVVWGGDYLRPLL